MLKLKRLTIHHYRNVKPGCQLRFDDGVNLTLGQNASGKTSLLALLSAVCRASFEGLKDEPFDLEYVLEGDRFRVDVRVSHIQACLPRDAKMLGVSLWDDTYDIVLASRDGEVVLRISDKEDSKGRPPLDICRSDSFLLVALLRRVLETKMEDIGRVLGDLRDLGQAFRLDESIDTFAVITGRAVSVGPAAPPPWSTTGHVRILENGGHMDSAEFIPAALSPLTAEDPLLGLFLGDFDLLKKMEKYLGFAKVTAKPNVSERRGDQSYVFRGFSFEFARENGTTIHHDRLSFGQKRLLAFLYYLACNPRIVIADEIVNGLHHRWIEGCMTEIGDRQAFLSSQNPLLFDYVSFDSVEHVQSAFVICEVEVVEEQEAMVWHNMPRSDAEQFFRAYESGIEHVGEILISRGLW